MSKWSVKKEVPKPAATASVPLPLKPATIPEPKGATRRIAAWKAAVTQQLPFDLDVEQAVLGSMIIEAQAVRTARQFLGMECFYSVAHQRIFKAILELTDSGSVADVVLLMAHLRDRDELQTIGGGHYLGELVNRVVTAEHVEHYAKKVSCLYLEREIIMTCHGLAAAGQEQRPKFLENLRKMHLTLESINSPYLLSYETGLVGLADEMLNPEIVKIFKTGYPTIDALWKAIKAGEVNTWAAATNEGKSVVLLNLMDRAALAGEKCLYVGTEMEAIETVQRHLSMRSGVEAWRIRKPELMKTHVSKIHSTMSDVMSKMKVSILDDPEPSLAKIEAAIYASKAEVVFLDYLERFEMPRAENLRLQIKEFMKRLKTLARRNKVVIHLAAQLNRDTYGVEERPPNLADLSESSAIEKESDRVVLMWSPRNGKAAPIRKGPPQATEQALPTPVLVAHQRFILANCAKNRHGPKNTTFEFVLNEIDLKVMEMQEHSNPFNRPIGPEDRP